MTHLSTHLLQQISLKPLPFVDFMQRALYDPQFGYYTGGLQKFGSLGDFITAPELSPLFGKALANQCLQVFHSLKNPNILEFGAGSGRLCVDILKHLEESQSLPETYFILEVSADLRTRQEDTIRTELPHLYSRVQWLSSWPKEQFEGVILANEVLDAMPVRRFKWDDQTLFESHITLNQHNEFSEVFLPCHEPRLVQFIERALPKDTPEPYISEANLFIDGWMAECAEILDKGAIFIIDYGFPRHEYYHPSRVEGTLICHYRHTAHSDFLTHIGEQDITAHVDFTTVAEAAVANKLEVAGFTNQAAFLMANGILGFLAEIPEGATQMKQNQAVKQLVQSHEMGELFKVLGLTKGLDLELQGFVLSNRLHAL